MKTKALSASRLKTWLQCKYKYGCVYHKFAPEIIKEKKDYLQMGTSAHEALEYAGKMVIKDSLTSFNEKHIELIVARYIEECSIQGLQEEATLFDGLDLLLAKLDKFEFNHKIISLEHMFKVEVAGVPVIGAMDKVVELDSNTLCVIDYKTSKSTLTDSEMETDIQLGMYDAVARQMYPGYSKYFVCLDYLRFYPKTASRDEEQRYSFIQLLKNSYKIITETKTEELKPELNKFCPWCEYADACPMMIDLQENLPTHKVFEDEESLADTYSKMRTLSKTLELKMKSIKETLVQKIKAAGGGKVSTDNYNVSTRQMARVNYDPNTLYNLIGADDLVGCVNVVNKRLDVLIKKGIISKQQAQRAANVSYSAPILDVRKKKGK